jgi:hypothetical protein
VFAPQRTAGVRAKTLVHLLALHKKAYSEVDWAGCVLAAYLCRAPSPRLSFETVSASNCPCALPTVVSCDAIVEALSGGMAFVFHRPLFHWLLFGSCSLSSIPQVLEMFPEVYERLLIKAREQWQEITQSLAQTKAQAAGLPQLECARRLAVLVLGADAIVLGGPA